MSRFRIRQRVAGLIVVALAAIGAAVWPATTAHAADPLISQNKPATASSVENPGAGGTPAYAAVDGSLTSRWPRSSPTHSG